jgi:hypothetical protein
MENQSEKDFLSLLLPKGLLDYFILSRYTETDQEINLYLDEKNLVPSEYQNDKLLSKGFFDEITIQDFPLRGRAVFLHIHRRRWLNQTSGQTVFRDWDMVAKGTRMTKEFASFLKAISRYPSGKL